MKKSIVKIILLSLAIIIVTPGLSYGLALGGDHGGNYQTNAYWPTNSNSLRQSPYDSFDRAPALKFKFSSGGVSTAPIIANDGTVYFCANGNMYALNPDGTQKWVANGVGAISDPVIGSDGTIYIMPTTASVIAINPGDGSILWEYSASNATYSSLWNFCFGGSLALGTAGEIYVIGMGTKTRVLDGTLVGDKTFVLTAINPDGSFKWKHMEFITYETYTYMYPYLRDDWILEKASPAVAQDGTVYSVLGKTFVAVKNGVLQKKDETLGYDHAISAPVFFNNKIYVVYDAVQVRDLTINKYVIPPLYGSVGCFDSSASSFSSHLWVTFDELTYPRGQIAVGSDGTLYGIDGMEYKALDFVTRLFTPACLYALNHTDGSVKWKFAVEKPLVGAPVVTQDDVIYACGYESNTVYAVNSNGTEKWRINPNKPRGMAIGSNGMIYVSGGDGLYAYMETKAVTFNTYGGSAVSTQNKFPGELASRPSQPTKPGHTFVDWYTDGSYTTPFDFSGTPITEDTTVHAKWSINTYQLTYSPGPNGSITGNTSQSAIYNTNGTAVTAVPNAGYHFVNWSDGKTTASRTDLNVSTDINVTANFAINTYTLSYQASGGHGTFSGNASQTVEHGANGTMITAVPATGYHFVNWSDGVETISRTDINITADITVTANFSINQYTLRYTAGVHGSLTGNTSQSAIHGSNGTIITAVADEGYHFINWSDGKTTASRTDLNVTADINVTANFAINTYTLSYLASGGHGSFLGSAIQTVDHGATGTAVTAVPATGYHFVNWSDGIETISRSDGSITSDITVTANFEINQYTMNYTAGENGSLTGSTSQTAIHGTDGTEVRALPDEWHHFVRWSDGITTASRTDLDVSGNIDVTAIFAIDTYSLHYLIGDGNGSFAGSASQTVDHGASGTAITAVPAAGYHFAGWSDGIESAERTDGNITGDRSIAANFAVDAPAIQPAIVGDTCVDITWNPVAGADGYKIYKRTESGTFGALFDTVDDSTLTIHFDGLTNGEPYYFAVRTVIGSDESVLSSEATGIPRTVPGVPTNVTAVGGNGQAVIIFTAPTDNGGSPITGYLATSSPGGITGAGVGTSITVTGLTNGAIFTFTVEAVNAAGSGSVSAESNPVTPQYTAGRGSTISDNTGANEIKKDGMYITVTASIRTVTDAGGRATAAVTAQQVSDSVKQIAESTKQIADAATELVISLNPARDSKSYTASIPQTAVKTIVDHDIDRVTLSTPVATLSFDRQAMAGISGGEGEIRITSELADTAALSESIKEIVGDRPVFHFSVSSGDRQISQFNGNVTVAVPYVPKADEDFNAIVIYYINSRGEAEIVKDCRYDPKTGTVIFSTNHFSQYAVGYRQVNFSDVSDQAWYRDAVKFLAARGITTGMGNDTFGVKTSLTRGQFLVMVMRAYGVSLDEKAEDNFADAGNTYYTDYLAAAKYLGITKGVGDNLYAPKKNINRQEMMVLLYNVLEVMGKLPSNKEGKELADFTDAGLISSWAEKPMNTLVKSGIISGSNGKINPLKTTNRAEMAQVIYNLLSR